MEKIFKIIQSDKSLHLLIGFFICVILQYPIQYEGFAIAILLGICKEMYDRNHSTKFISYSFTDTNPIQQGFNFWLKANSVSWSYFLGDIFTNGSGYLSTPTPFTDTYLLEVTTTDDSKYEAFNVKIKKDGVVIFDTNDSGCQVQTSFVAEYGHYYEIIVTSRVVTPTTITVNVNYSNNDGDGTCRIIIDGTTYSVYDSSSFTIAIGSTFHVSCTSPSSSGGTINFSYTGDYFEGPKSVSSSTYTATSAMNNSGFTVITGGISLV